MYCTHHLTTALAQLVKYVEVTFVLRRLRNTNLLQQVVRSFGGAYVQVAIEKDLHVFTEARGVVISDGLRVTETLEDLQ